MTEEEACGGGQICDVNRTSPDGLAGRRIHKRGATSRRQRGGSEAVLDHPHHPKRQSAFLLLPTTAPPAFKAAPTPVHSTRVDHATLKSHPCSWYYLIKTTSRQCQTQVPFPMEVCHRREEICKGIFFPGASVGIPSRRVEPKAGHASGLRRPERQHFSVV